jgi:SAM-dependent methyltransferase
LGTDQDRVRQYYARFGEWERLDAPEGALELRRSLALLDQRLPPSSRVLDLGGGPGRYAIELARRGHRVVLADLSPVLLETARQKIAERGMADQIESVDEVEATDLGRYPDQSFDAVVAFGPFYHLQSEDERAAAATEIHRVLRPAGLAFAAFIPRLSGIAGLIDHAASSPQQVPAGVLTSAATGGTFHNGASEGFQEGYHPTPEEIRALFESARFEVVDAVSLRSIANRLERALARLDGPRRAEVERLMEELGRHPAVLATGGHAVLVARRS